MSEDSAGGAIGLAFQDAVSRLQAFWAERGCAVWLPHNVEVGAGTMNPGTFLYVLGPEPWNVVYVEPSIRPDDARYGENPNRMGRHHQVQVILKPDPGDPQGLFLESLAALGIDLRRHDIRFVEDDWESPALGAWGLGWEVWLDGLEITQFTYFQQAGSFELDPVAVEITYGLDRILMAIQDVRHFRDLAWNEHLRFGDILYAYEAQNSRYYFETADVGRLRRMFDDAEAEAEAAVAVGLVHPAHDYVLKCSHLFNVLDARGAVGVTERARFFGRMRRLARLIAEGYLREREALGYPLASRGAWVAGKGPTDAADVESAGAREMPDRDAAAAPTDDDFVLEVGTEELPATDVDAAVDALGTRIPALLDELRLPHRGVTVAGTPRRLVVMVRALAGRQQDVEREVVGPPVAAAYDPQGAPTKAAEGFARSAGVNVGDLRIVERGGDSRVAVTRKDDGRPTGDVLGEALGAMLAALPFAKSMRWNRSGASFSRPVRWIVALHGERVVPLAFAGVDAGRTTRGLRPMGSPVMGLACAEDYGKLMRAHGVLLDPGARRAEVARQAAAAAEGAGGSVPDDPDLVAEVANLVEQPKAVLGRFDETYLELPAPVLTTVLKKHQRFFPVVAPDGSLRPAFVAVANGATVDADVVRHGNEAVVRARFADAAYFWRKDTLQPLEAFTPRLAGLAFHADLGSVLDKVGRLRRLVPLIALRLGIDESAAGAALRAAELAKSDLATSMVVDFTSLQGVIGREYALLAGEPAAVADALLEQYRPRGGTDDLPATDAGTALALADRLDSLVGLFAAGVRPSGTQDPYALRRAAVGVAAILVGRGGRFDLAEAVDDAAEGLPLEASAECRREVVDFVTRRLEVMLREQGHAADQVSAVLGAVGHDPAAAVAALAALERHVADEGWADVLNAYARCARIVRGVTDIPDGIDLDLLGGAEERALAAAVEAVESATDPTDADAVLRALAALAPTIHLFFDQVLVMAEDPRLRANRLALVHRVARLPRAVADLSKMEGF